MFEGFRLSTVDTVQASIRVRHGGSGPPLLLLHGSPQAHGMWHLIAPRLAEEVTVIATDLRRYGDSSKPESAPDHEHYSKRTMALDQIEVMRHFGFERFALCGHDRGGRVGYRMALDHPGVVTKLAVLDIVPTWEAFSRADLAFGLSYWHWFYLAQPFDLPKRLLTADPENTLFRGGSETISPEAMEQYVRCLRGLPRRRHRRHRPRRRRPRGRRIACPVLALWGRKGFHEEHYEVLEVWRGWAEEVRGRVLECGHYIPEEAPDETYAELREFFGE